MSTAPTTPRTTDDDNMEESRLPSSPLSSPPAEGVTEEMMDEKDQTMVEKQDDAAQMADVEMGEDNAEVEDENMEVDSNNVEAEEDDAEDMDFKTKGLMNLLKTSHVFTAIMADKMKKQQEQQREAAARAVTRAEAAPAETPTTTTRKITRGMQKKNENEVLEVEGNTKKPSRGRPRKAGGKENIATYFKKADISAEKPSVQEALDQAAEEFEAEPAAIGEHKLVATAQPKFVTGGNMREYQLEGLEWMKTLYMNGLSGILADEMGLGKTIQAISFLAFFRENNIPGPFLIAAPVSTLSNWMDEFARWTPDIPTVLYHGQKPLREEVRKERMSLKDQKQMDFPVVITSYELIMNDRKFLAQYQWRYIIIDEGHRLKNMNCKLIKELMTYSSANRLLITGTPLQNNIAELWSLLHFLLPEVFNDLKSFESWFDFSSVLDTKGQDGLAEKRKRSVVSTIHAILKPFLLRRVKTDVESSLPKKREYILYAPLTAEQKELYREILSGSSRQYLEDKAVERIDARNLKTLASTLKRKAGDDSGSSTPSKSARSSRASTPGSSARRRRGRPAYIDITDHEFDQKLRGLNGGFEEIPSQSVSSGEEEELERAKTLKLAKKEIGSKKLLNPIMQARLCCNSPYNFYWPFQPGEPPDERLVTSSGKLLLLDRLVSALFERGHKILIFSQFKTTLDIIQDWGGGLRGYKCCRIDGSVTQVDRQAQIKAFNTDPTFKLFLLSTRAGGQGINLTAADTVILFDSDWNPQQDLQAQDRAHRIGQTKPVIVYRLATKGTVEQTLLEKADSKRRLEKLVIQKGKFRSLTYDTKTAEDADEIKKILSEDDWEKYDLEDEEDYVGTTADGLGSGPKKVKEILSERDLAILLDRSEEAYVKAAKGIDAEGNVFKAVETKADGQDLLGGLEKN